jgi:pimeloyl-ACP methyl ester carboxylesterase
VPGPETHYARSGDVHIAYQQFGAGDIDLVYVNGFTSHIELVWEHEPSARFLRRLGSFARVITFDRRGSGLSDPVSEAPTLEQRMDDLRAVMDAAGVQRAAIVGASEGVSMSILFAATYPERVQALICGGGMARSTWAEDYPWAPRVDGLLESMVELIAPAWGTGAIVEVAAPSQAENAEVRKFYGRMERASASPGMLAALIAMFLDIDVRAVCAGVRVPVLVVHRTHDRLVNVRNGRWLAEHLPGARLLELPGDDHIPYYENVDEALGEMQEFLTGARDRPEPRRALATVLFTDLVDSTRTAAELGDQRWRELLESHQRVVRESLTRFDGREVKSLGDGFLATFDGPARAIRGAQQIISASRAIGVPVRAGIHTGECELMGEDIGGIAVHIAARVSALAGSGELLVSRTVKDLVAGSGIAFDDRGTHELKGVPDSWQLLAVQS